MIDVVVKNLYEYEYCMEYFNNKIKKRKQQLTITSKVVMDETRSRFNLHGRVQYP